MLWNLGVKRISGKLQFHAGRVVRFGAGAAAGAGPAHSSTPDLFRSQNSSQPRGSLSLSRSLIAAGLVDDRSSSTRRSLAAAAQAPTRATALSGPVAARRFSDRRTGRLARLSSLAVTRGRSPPRRPPGFWSASPQRALSPKP